ncbi:MAG: hypothetical protein AMXMBFR4_22900 [Candidatus Hydrogenedentota bacterium]
MMKRVSVVGLAGLAVIVAQLPLAANENAAPSIVVDGALPRTGTFGVDQLAALGEIAVAWPKGEDAADWTGVPVSSLLAHLGLKPDEEVCEGVDAKVKRPGLRKALVVSARDGYQTVFSMAELFETFGSGQVFLVWKKAGQPLDAQEGPFRILATEDKKPSRCVFQVVKFTVVDLAAQPTTDK